MNNTVQDSTTIKTFIIKAIAHSETWGKVWFGFIFLGSVFNALLIEFNVDIGDFTRLSLAFGNGLTLGIVAHLRGRWV